MNFESGSSAVNSTSAHRQKSHASLRDWAELIRVPNTFSTIADIFAGYAIVSGTLSPTPSLILTALASVSLYWSGMVLNDVHDIDADRAAQRCRPLSDGRIRYAAAARAGILLLFAGCLLAGVSGWSRVVGVWEGDGLLIATLLAVSIVAYDSRWKSTFAGPMLMGGCRGLNLLLGMSAGADLFSVSWQNDWWMLLSALASMIFVAGFTVAARREERKSSRQMLIAGWGMAAVGIAIWCVIPWLASGDRILYLDAYRWFPLLILAVSLPWLRRVVHSVKSLEPKTVQLAIKQSILTLIFLDASAALVFAGPIAGIATSLLVLPMAILGLWFRST